MASWIWRRIVFIMGVTLVMSVPALRSTHGADQPLPEDAKLLFEKKCSVCHALDRPQSKRKTKEAWEKTVLRMKHTHGASLSDEEAAAIIRYLSETYGP